MKLLLAAVLALVAARANAGCSNASAANVVLGSGCEVIISTNGTQTIVPGAGGLTITYGLNVGTISASGNVTASSVTVNGPLKAGAANADFASGLTDYSQIWKGSQGNALFAGVSVNSPYGAWMTTNGSSYPLYFQQIGGQTLFGGSVGIGTASPGATLHVGGNAAFSSGITASSVTLTSAYPIKLPKASYVDWGDTWAEAGNILAFRQAGTVMFAFTSKDGMLGTGNGYGGARFELPVQSAAGSIYNPSYGFSGEQGFGLYRPAANTLGFVSNNAEHSRITSGGLWGIGTTAPGAALHVVGSEILTSSLTVGGSVFVPLGGAAAGGIGVVGTGDRTILVQGGTSGAVETAMRAILLRGQFGTTTNHQASMIQNGTEVVTIPAGGGKVGILTITPSTALDVEGNAQFGSGATKSTFTATGFWEPISKTKAQIDALVPTKVGQYIFVSNHTIPGLCVSTGTAAAQWRKEYSATIGCGTNE